MESILQINKLLIKHFGIPKRQNPLPDPLDTLIATILSQNTNDNNSYKAFNNLKNAFADWGEAADARRSTIEKLIKVAGLAPAKSKAIKNLLVDLKAKYGKLSLDFLNESKKIFYLIKPFAYSQQNNLTNLDSLLPYFVNKWYPCVFFIRL